MIFVLVCLVFWLCQINFVCSMCLEYSFATICLIHTADTDKTSISGHVRVGSHSIGDRSRLSRNAVGIIIIIIIMMMMMMMMMMFW